MKKIVDYSVLVASGVLVLNGTMSAFKVVKAKDYKSLLFVALGVAVSAYAFSYALDKIKEPVAPKVVVLEKEVAAPEGE